MLNECADGHINNEDSMKQKEEVITHKERRIKTPDNDLNIEANKKSFYLSVSSFVPKENVLD